MKIAIHNSKGDFAERWIEYCKGKNIPYKTVCCYDSDIINQLADCDALMWHHNHVLPKDVLFAKQLTFALEFSGKKVFPDCRTSWHFDDKLGQKYLLESIGAPLVQSYAFYSKAEALHWINNTNFPKVFKLRGGAGSKNVKLVNTKDEAIKLTKIAFGKGFRQYDSLGAIKEQIRKYRLQKSRITDILKAIAHLVYPIQIELAKGREKGYLYFQDFIQGNSFDIRIVVIGDKAFAIKRLVRKNDFRASGSGNIIYDRTQIDERCVQIAFHTNENIQSQSLAVDFVFDNKYNPLIVEVSYGFMAKGYDTCPGYWDKQIKWHEGLFNPYGWMVENLLKKSK